jgi:hypothetical protein
MGLGAVARSISDVVAVLAAGAGALVVVFAIEKAVSPSPFDVTSVPEHRLKIVVIVVAGVVLVGYAAAHVALRRRPFSRRAIAVRAAFTVAGGVLGAVTVRSALAFLNSPDPGSCGLPAFAAQVHILVVGMFAVVEASAWVGWWTSGVGQP